MCKFVRKSVSLCSTHTQTTSRHSNCLAQPATKPLVSSLRLLRCVFLSPTPTHSFLASLAVRLHQLPMAQAYQANPPWVTNMSQRFDKNRSFSRLNWDSTKFNGTIEGMPKYADWRQALLTFSRIHQLDVEHFYRMQDEPASHHRDRRSLLASLNHQVFRKSLERLALTQYDLLFSRLRRPLPCFGDDHTGQLTQPLIC